MNFEELSIIFTFIIQIGTLITLLYTVTKFLTKPNKTQNERIRKLEEWKKEVDKRLDSGNERFESIDEGNRVLQESMLALLSHALDGNDVDKLKQAKDRLQTYLISK